MEYAEPCLKGKRSQLGGRRYLDFSLGRLSFSREAEGREAKVKVGWSSVQSSVANPQSSVR